MKKKSVFCLSAIVCAISTTIAHGQTSTLAENAIVTSSYTTTLGVIKTAQITYNNVYKYPAFNEQWFSTVRTCNTVGNLFAGTGPLPIRFDIHDDDGKIIKTLPTVTLEPNKCVSFTSDIANDPLFKGLKPGVYQVTATVIAPDASVLVEILVAGGNLNGGVNSTARNFIKPNENA